MHTSRFSRLAIAIATADVAAAAVLMTTPVNPPLPLQPRDLDLVQPSALEPTPNQTKLTGFDLVQAGTLARPSTNATIGQWVVANPPEDIANQSSLLLQKCVGNIDNVDVSAPNVSDWSCSLPANLVARDGPGRRLPYEVENVRPLAQRMPMATDTILPFLQDSVPTTSSAISNPRTAERWSTTQPYYPCISLS